MTTINIGDLFACPVGVALPLWRSINDGVFQGYFWSSDELWLVVGVVQSGVPYHYVLGSSGCHGWTNSVDLLEKVTK